MTTIYNNQKSRWKVSIVGAILLFAGYLSNAQTASDSLLRDATLDNVVQYAIRNQPYIIQTQYDQEVTNAQIKGKIPDWYPQITGQYNYQHIYQQGAFVTSQNGVTNIIRTGSPNGSSPQIYGTLNLLNRDVLLASKTATEVRARAAESTTSAKIDAAVNVTKGFYDVLATSQQIKLGLGDIARLKQSLKTAYDQYQGGVVDKTDYKRATIALQNTEATLKTNQELLKYKLEYLKYLMGYPPHGELNIKYDTMQMENEIMFDTMQNLDYKQRIDYKILESNRILQNANVKYAKWSWIPAVQAYGYWINNYYAPNFSDMYNKRFPNTYAGLTVTLPLFQGFKRNANIAQQKWSLRRIDEDIVNFRNVSNSQYAQTMAMYKGNLNNYLTLKQNVALAKEVYDIIQLQYKNGVKSYLEVITAETDLRNTRINYFNALYQVLASKIDVQKALGQIIY